MTSLVTRGLGIAPYGLVTRGLGATGTPTPPLVVIAWTAVLIAAPADPFARDPRLSRLLN